MFERLLDLLVHAWGRISPVEVINAYEGAIVLRLGKYHRTLAPGLHFKWPFVEQAFSSRTCVTTLRLSPQTLTTKDDVPVVVSAIVKYQINDVKLYHLQIWDAADVLADVTMGAIRFAVNAVPYTALIAQPPEPQVLEAVRKEVNKYGFRVHKITFIDLGRVKSLRLLQHEPPPHTA